MISREAHLASKDVPWNRDITAEGKKHTSKKESYPTNRQTK